MAQFPAWAEPLFRPARYKVLHGGRGSGKSWAIARALLIQGAQDKLRILCTREVQKSLKDSVHALLSDQIQALGLSALYQVLETEIRCVNGTQILFAGLQQHTIESIKSFEAVDRVWVEEAQSVSEKSWDVLIPTIRRPGSEIWVSLNPQLETDPTYQRFIAAPPPGALVVAANWWDNPWMPAELTAEREHAQKTMSVAKYRHIWEGACMPAVDGAIYFDEITQAEQDKRIGRFPRDPQLKVHRIWDMGWNDAMAIILAQRHGSQITVCGFVTGTRRTVSDYMADFRGDKYRGWNWGKDFLPHDGFAKSRQTGKADADILRGLDCEVVQTPNMDVEQGIRAARDLFPRVYFDAEGCASCDPDLPGLVECLKRYRRRINQQTQVAEGPLHDVHSNGADAYRYLALNAEQMTNEDLKPLDLPISDDAAGSWMSA